MPGEEIDRMEPTDPAKLGLTESVPDALTIETVVAVGKVWSGVQDYVEYLFRRWRKAHGWNTGSPMFDGWGLISIDHMSDGVARARFLLNDQPFEVDLAQLYEHA